MAAAPWVAMGMALAVFFANRGARHKNEKKQSEDYGSEGMCLGMCLGTAIGVALGFGVHAGISYGMLLGLVIGSGIPKNHEESETTSEK